MSFEGSIPKPQVPGCSTGRKVGKEGTGNILLPCAANRLSSSIEERLGCRIRALVFHPGAISHPLGYWRQCLLKLGLAEGQNDLEPSSQMLRLQRGPTPGSENPFHLRASILVLQEWLPTPSCDETTRNSAERENEIPQRKVNFPSDVTLLPFEGMVLPPGSSRLPCTLPRGHEEQKCFFCPLHLFCALRPHES